MNSAASRHSGTPSRSLRADLPVATWLLVFFSRVGLNLGQRLTYPFLPVIARGLGLSFAEAGLLVSARHLAGLSGPWWGKLGDRRGYVGGMLLGVCFLAVGGSVVSGSGGFLVALLGFVFIGLSKAAYDPNLQAYVSARVPYYRRGRAMGILELAWSGSWLLGIPLCGILIAHLGWRSPFVVLAGSGVAFFCWTRHLLGKGEGAPQVRVPPSRRQPADAGGSRPHLVIAAVFCLILANENLFMVYGAWMEAAFGLGVQTLGFSSMLIGFAELAGELSVVALVDRLGKRRAIIAGMALTGAGYLVLPLCRGSAASALAGLTLVFFLFEFTVVSTFPYVSELVPDRRSTWLAYNYAAMVVGRLIGSVTGPLLWQWGGDIAVPVSLSVPVQIAAIVFLAAARTARPASGPGE